MHSLSFFRPLEDTSLSPRLSFSIRAKNEKTGMDTGEKSASFAFTCPLWKMILGAAAVFFALKILLMIYRRFAVCKVKRKYQKKLSRLKMKKK